MNRQTRTHSRVFLSLIECLVLLALVQAQPAHAQPAGAGFLGEWCAQGDSSKRATITNNGPGPFFTLRNENGDSSPGNLEGNAQNVMVAPGWQFVRGTLSGDGRRIDWSNGTFWARCRGNGGGGGWGRPPNIDGTWYRSGDQSQRCYIRQRRGDLKLTNESGTTATGSFDDRRHITTNWNGTTIGGTVVSSGDRINWDNGTYWTR